MALGMAARVAGLLGGLAWVVGYFVLADALWWAGLALLGFAFVVTGALLVSRSAMLLRIFVAVAFPALAWSVLQVLHNATADRAVDAVVGGAVAAAAVVSLARARGMAGAAA